jgi:hypothetical protein
MRYATLSAFLEGECKRLAQAGYESAARHLFLAMRSIGRVDDMLDGADLLPLRLVERTKGQEEALPTVPLSQNRD